MKALKKYLDRFAEPSILGYDLGFGSSDIATSAICIIPFFDESEQSLLQFLEHRFSAHVTFVYVVNCPEEAEIDQVSRTTQAVSELKSRYAFQAISETLCTAGISDSCRLYLLDLTRPRDHLPRKQGVGLARKMGMDLAIRLCNEQFEARGVIPKWLFSCDADVTLPAGYFEIPEPNDGQVVSLFPFKHVEVSGSELGLALYDLKLRYYVDQLRRAGSPFAFQTVGSAIAVTPLAYAQVRGMPKRSGAEDFYFLNKLAKVGQVHQLESPKLLVSGRASHRVPFGTGPAIEDIHKMSSPVSDYLYYHPESFDRLKEVHVSVSLCEEATSTARFEDALRRLAAPDNASKSLSVLEELGVQKFYQHLEKQNRLESFQEEFWIWFDAFLTLRFIHLMRDKYYPSLNIECLKPYSHLLSEEVIDSIQNIESYSK